jgi:hypothetical protein
MMATSRNTAMAIRCGSAFFRIAEFIMEMQ